MPKKKRVNKSKEEIAEHIASQARVERMKALVRLMWPFIEDQKSIYDAQTVVSAAGGFIKESLQVKTKGITVADLELDLSVKEADNAVHTAAVKIIELLKTEPAESTAALLDRFGQTLGSFSSKKYLQNPMSAITLEEFMAS